MSKADDALLKEIRENWDYAKAFWDPIHEEGRKDIRFRAGDPWPAAEKARRTNPPPGETARLCLVVDIIGQYCNAAVNEVRQNKRAAKCTPIGDGANDKDARRRASIIRGIEYDSKAPQGAYITGFEGATERGYGYCKLGIEYESPRSSNRKLVISDIPNPNVIFLDPDFKKIDASDMMYGFEVDNMRESAFRRDFPRANIRDFAATHMLEAPAWITTAGTGNAQIQVVVYWRVKKTTKMLVIPPAGKNLFLEEIPGAELLNVRESERGDDTGELHVNGQIIQVGTRESEVSEVCKYITNGVEILKTSPTDFSRVPIFPCFAKKLYVGDQGAPERLQLRSLIRAARDPYLAYCAVRTSEVELAMDTPKNLWSGYEGQFDTSTDWANIGRNKTVYVEFKAKTAATGEGPADPTLPMPELQRYEPPIDRLDMLASSLERTVQATMSMGSAAVGQEDSRSRSGVAIEKLQRQANTGSYHLTDSLEGMITAVNQEVNHCLEYVYDTPRDVTTIDDEDKPGMMRINEPTQDPKSGEQYEFRTNKGQYGVTISTGPNSDSQREEVNEFTSSLIQLPNVPPKAIAQSIRMRNFGALGDKLADTFSPEEDGKIPPAVQQKLEQSGQMIEALTETVKTLQGKIDSKEHELDSKEYISQLQEETKRLKIEADSNSEQVRASLEELRAELDVTKYRLELVHKSESQDADQAHESEQAAADRDAQAEQAALGRVSAEAQGEQQRQHELTLQQTAPVAEGAE